MQKYDAKQQWHTKSWNADLACPIANHTLWLRNQNEISQNKRRLFHGRDLTPFTPTPWTCLGRKSRGMILQVTRSCAGRGRYTTYAFSGLNKELHYVRGNETAFPRKHLIVRNAQLCAWLHLHTWLYNITGTAGALKRSAILQTKEK